jgi:5-formyltetrahydrofolate cyclo-ligase
MPSGEISTSEIVKRSFQEGKKIYVPFTYKLTSPRESWPKCLMDMVRLESLSDYQSLKPDKWGIPSPDTDTINQRQNCYGGMGKSEGDAAEEPTDSELDIVIMPGLAFDRRLERLGHGKGYYDFLLQRCAWYSEKTSRKMPFLGKAKKNHRFFKGLIMVQL